MHTSIQFLLLIVLMTVLYVLVTQISTAKSQSGRNAKVRFNVVFSQRFAVEDHRVILVILCVLLFVFPVCHLSFLLVCKSVLEFCIHSASMPVFGPVNMCVKLSHFSPSYSVASCDHDLLFSLYIATIL